MLGESQFHARVEQLSVNDLWLLDHMVTAFWHTFGIAHGLRIDPERDLQTVRYPKGPDGHYVKAEAMRAKLEEYIGWLRRYQRSWGTGNYNQVYPADLLLQGLFNQEYPWWEKVVEMIDLLQIGVAAALSSAEREAPLSEGTALGTADRQRGQPHAPGYLLYCPAGEDARAMAIVRVGEEQILALADTLRRQRALQQILACVQAAYGEWCGAATLRLRVGESPHAQDHVTVLDREGREVSPDYTLPFWRTHHDLEGIEEEALVQEGAAGHDGQQETPAGRGFPVVSILADLLRHTFGPLGSGEERPFHLDDDEARSLLAFSFPRAFLEVEAPS